MRVFENEKQNCSVRIAKERLKSLIVTDRVNCQPETYDFLRNELYRTVSKYMNIRDKDFNVEITRSSILIKLTGDKR